MNWNTTILFNSTKIVSSDILIFKIRIASKKFREIEKKLLPN